MNSQIRILENTLPLQQSLDEVEKMIQQIKTFNIQQKYPLLDNRIQALQSLDTKTYKNHFDKFMEILEPSIPPDNKITLDILNQITEDTKDYVNHLSSLHNLLVATHSQFNYMTLTSNTFDLYDDISNQYTFMRELIESATNKLEQISRNYKGTFTPDSREIEYSRFLLTMAGSIGRIEKEVKNYGDELKDTVGRLNARLEQLNKDMRAINQKVDCVSQIVDYLGDNCKQKLKEIRFKRNLGGIIGGVLLLLMAITSYYEVFTNDFSYIPLIGAVLYMGFNHYEYKKHQIVIFNALGQLKEVMLKAVQTQNKRKL